jgi:hypothetical protein
MEGLAKSRRPIPDVIRFISYVKGFSIHGRFWKGENLLDLIQNVAHVSVGSADRGTSWMKIPTAMSDPPKLPFIAGVPRTPDVGGSNHGPTKREGGGTG